MTDSALFNQACVYIRELEAKLERERAISSFLLTEVQSQEEALQRVEAECRSSPDAILAMRIYAAAKLR